DDWRRRQRLEQYQDNIVQMGHSGYLTVARRACVYTLKLHRVEASPAHIDRLMQAWWQLEPFPDVLPALRRLQEHFQLVALSNGERQFLEHLSSNCIGWDFDQIFSVEHVGAFKPHPGVYRAAAHALRLELNQCLMVSSNSFDVMGARMCGYRGIYVDRYDLPYEDTPFVPDAHVADFQQLADLLTAD
ncbi:MAG: haloacid dehalogenase type II, partial [Planctomycetaceae bacterium]